MGPAGLDLVFLLSSACQAFLSEALVLTTCCVRYPDGKQISGPSLASKGPLERCSPCHRGINCAGIADIRVSTGVCMRMPQTVLGCPGRKDIARMPPKSFFVSFSEASPSVVRTQEASWSGSRKTQLCRGLSPHQEGVAVICSACGQSCPV